MTTERPSGPGSATAGDTHRVVVVDDEPSIRELCADVLSGEGYEVTTAANGREAVELVTRRPADLVLMDIMMPVMDGLSACRLMQANDRTRNIPVIIMSAATNLHERVADLKCGAAAVLAKPFDFDLLLDTVKQLVA